MKREVRRAGLPAAVLSLLLLGGCAEHTQLFKTLSWFGPRSGAPALNEKFVTLPEDPASLGDGPVEGRLRNVIALSKAKRFGEARLELANLSGSLPPGSDLWRAVKCAEMSVALRDGDLRAAIEADEALERLLPDPLRPPAECAAPIAIARAAVGRPLPLTTPEALARELHGYAARRQETRPERAAALAVSR